MRRVADVAESYLQAGLDASNSAGGASVARAMEDAVAMLCRTLPVTKVVAVTRSGYAARMLAARLIRQPILAVSDDWKMARGFNLLPGVEGVYLDIKFSRTSADHIMKCLKELWRRKKLTSDDLVLSTAVTYPRSGNRMNILQTHYVRDLIESLGWRA
jgi:pyruvate kinase